VFVRDNNKSRLSTVRSFHYCSDGCHTEICAMSENLVGQEKKNNNIIVVTCDFVLPHKLTVVTEHAVVVNLLPGNVTVRR
jgi:peroxiredoxin